MVRGEVENSDLSWLKSMMKNELDLRPPSLVKTNQSRKLIRDEQGNPIAHVAITNRWQGSEINSLVVTPHTEERGCPTNYYPKHWVHGYSVTLETRGYNPH